MIIIGIALITISIALLQSAFSKDEWYAPLMELTSKLRYEGTEPYVGYKRRSIISVIILFILFGVGCILVLRSPLIERYRTIGLIILGLLSIWFLKGFYEIIRAFLSKKVRLLNYLFSPYLFAWRRDRLIKYSDKEIALAILKACNIKGDSLIKEEIKLKDFLIALHGKTMQASKQDSKAYLGLLEENIQKAERMVRI